MSRMLSAREMSSTWVSDAVSTISRYSRSVGLLRVGDGSTRAVPPAEAGQGGGRRPGGVHEPAQQSREDGLALASHDVVDERETAVQSGALHAIAIRPPEDHGDLRQALLEF